MDQKSGGVCFVVGLHHYADVRWARWRLKSPASRLFTQPFIQAQIKENIKAQRHWPLCGEFTGDWWIPTQWASNVGYVSIWWHHHIVMQSVIWNLHTLLRIIVYEILMYTGNKVFVLVANMLHITDFVIMALHLWFVQYSYAYVHSYLCFEGVMALCSIITDSLWLYCVTM